MEFSGGELVVSKEKIEADQNLDHDLKWMLNTIWLTYLKSPSAPGAYVAGPHRLQAHQLDHEEDDLGSIPGWAPLCGCAT